jgi:hypothetical protein
VGETSFAPQTTIDHGKSSDTLLIDHRVSGCLISALWAKTGSRREGGPSGLEVFRRLGNKAGFAAQTTIEHWEIA